MIDESMGKNTKVKKLILKEFYKNMELQVKLGNSAADLSGKFVKLTNLKKGSFYWTADMKISYSIEGVRLPVRWVERILRKEASNVNL